MRIKPHQYIGISLFILSFVITLSLSPTTLQAQEEPRVQKLSGQIEIDEIMHYNLPNLKAGDTLSATMTHTSGNLDPALLLTTGDTDTAGLIPELRAQREAEIAAGADPVEALITVITSNFLAADDNNGPDSNAAIEFTIPEDGDYLLLAIGTPVNETFGGYDLVVGLNAPSILEGRPQVTNDEIAFLDREASGIATAVQNITNTFTPEEQLHRYTLTDNITAGDTIYAYIETTSTDLIPLIELKDYSGRTLRAPNNTLLNKQAAFEIPIPESLAGESLQIEVTACCADGDAIPVGDYRLQVGINSPETLIGEGVEIGRKIVRGAAPVLIGVKLQQITGVDQKAENYGAVYQIEMRWNDPSQAFNPDECRCQFKTFLGSGFSKLVSDENFRWPDFTIFNQQDRRWTQNQGIIVNSNGDMTYFERFTGTLQAPDFDFRAFPFDTQEFYLRVDSLYPQTFYTFDAPLEASEVGDQLGEEEWVMNSWDTEVSQLPGLGVAPSSRFSFGFTAHRHLNFYIMRIFLPTILIIVVSYFTFFLQDYSKRIDVTSANLLVFVAFNFTISNDLPRLGYLTFLDAILAGVFAITAFVVAFNVFLRRLEQKGKEDLARRIDRYTLWIYPVAYIIGGVILVINFLLPAYWTSILATLGLA